MMGTFECFFSLLYLFFGVYNLDYKWALNAWAINGQISLNQLSDSPRNYTAQCTFT